MRCEIERIVPTDLIAGFVRTDAVVLEAGGDEEWTFQLRFPDHDALTAFHDYVVAHDILIHVERTYKLMETDERGADGDVYTVRVRQASAGRFPGMAWVGPVWVEAR